MSRPWLQLILLFAADMFNVDCQPQGPSFTFGPPPVSRTYVDNRTKTIIIPDPSTFFPTHGRIMQWQFYANRTGTVFLQVWRPTGPFMSNSFKLIGQTVHVARRTGLNTVNVSPRQAIDVLRGDVIGFYYPGSGVIAFDRQLCSRPKLCYLSRPTSSQLKNGAVVTFKRYSKTGWIPCRKYSVRVSVGAAPTGRSFTLGQAPVNRSYVDSWTRAIIIPQPSLNFPRNGRVSRWQLYAKRVGRVFLQIWRPMVETGHFRLIGQTLYIVSSTGLKTINVSPAQPINVVRGDVIGFYYPGTGVIAFDGKSCNKTDMYYILQPNSSQLRTSAAVTFKHYARTGWKPCRKYSVRVTVSQTETPSKPINGGWSPWSQWSSCSRTCGRGYKSRRRICASPRPQRGGRYCVGRPSQSSSCHLQKICSRPVFTFGPPAVSRTYVDNSTKTIIIPDHSTFLPTYGRIIQWQFYANRTGTVFLQIWRPTGPFMSNSFKLTGQTVYVARRTGLHTVNVSPRQAIDVLRGDVIGFYYPGSGVIAFDRRLCSRPKLYYVSSPASSQLKNGAVVTFKRYSKTGWIPCRKYSVGVTVGSAPVGRSFTLGQAPVNRSYVDSWTRAIIIPQPSLNSPRNGRVSRWQLYAKRVGKVFLQIWRPMLETGHFRLIGQTLYTVSSTGLKTINVSPAQPINVVRGDVIGFYYPGPGVIAFDGKSCNKTDMYYLLQPTSSQLRTFAAVTFKHYARTGWKPCRKYSVQVLVTASQTETPSKPIHGGWSPWSQWSSCSRTCGRGYKSRRRICASPRPQRGGRYCVGQSSQSSSCYLQRICSGPVFTFGPPPISRTYVDNRTKTIIIPDLSTFFPTHGRIIQWQFYANRTGTVFLQIWRPTGPFMSNSFKLTGQTVYVTRRTGLHTVNVSPRQPIDVLRGDVIGFYYPGSGVIAFDRQLCSRPKLRYLSRPASSQLKNGAVVTFKKYSKTGWIPCRKYSVRVRVGVAPIGQSFTLGQAPINRPYTDLWTRAIIIPQPYLSFPRNGRVSRWQLYAKRVGRVFLQIWRPMVESGHFRLIGQTLYTARSRGLKTINVSRYRAIYVARGDVIGFYFPGPGVIAFDGKSCNKSDFYYVWRPTSLQLRKYAAFTFKHYASKCWKPCRKYSVRVTVSQTGAPIRPINGNWSRWGRWSSCSRTCGRGLKIRKRSCTNPRPRHGGRYCVGPSTQKMSCLLLTKCTGPPITLGQAAVNRPYVDTLAGVLIIPKPFVRMPRDGHVKWWQLYAKQTGTVYLQIWRPTSPYGRFELVGQTLYTAKCTGMKTITLSPRQIINVRSGDVVGFYYPESGIIAYDGASCRQNLAYLLSPASSPPRNGTSVSFRPCRKYSVRVNILPTVPRRG